MRVNGERIVFVSDPEGARGGGFSSGEDALSDAPVGNNGN